jgi:SagB-type dehydrogenase family enzyme
MTSRLLVEAYELPAGHNRDPVLREAHAVLDRFLHGTATLGRESTGAEFDFVMPQFETQAVSNLQLRGAGLRRSNRAFACRELPWPNVEHLLKQALVDGAARTYPSAGAIYPVEIFAVSLRPGAKYLMYFDPAQSALLPVPGVGIADRTSAILQDSIEEFGVHFSNAQVALIYVIQKRRAVSKYGARGARFAMMEVGAVYQQVGNAAYAMNIGTCLFGASPDSTVTDSIGLDAAIFGYCATHVLGWLDD